MPSSDTGWQAIADLMPTSEMPASHETRVVGYKNDTDGQVDDPDTSRRRDLIDETETGSAYRRAKHRLADWSVATDILGGQPSFNWQATTAMKPKLPVPTSF